MIEYAIFLHGLKNEIWHKGSPNVDYMPSPEKARDTTLDDEKIIGT